MLTFSVSPKVNVEHQSKRGDRTEQASFGSDSFHVLATLAGEHEDGGTGVFVVFGANLYGKGLAMVAAMGEIFADTKEEKNNWKKKMLKAGLGEGMNLPENWDTLTEDEKERRLNGAIDMLK